MITNKELKLLQESLKHIQQIYKSLSPMIDAIKPYQEMSRVIGERMKIYHQLAEKMAQFNSALIPASTIKQLQEFQKRMNKLPSLSDFSISPSITSSSKINAMLRNISSSASEEERIKYFVKEALKEAKIEEAEQLERDRQELNKKKISGFGKE